MDKNKETTFDLIRQRLFSPDGDLIELTDKQQQMLDRWNYVIELKCMSIFNNDIVSRLMMEYNIERSTAFNDIGYAEALFGYSTPLNKRFRIGARINYLEQYIQELRMSGFHKEAAMQEANLRRLYIQYPDAGLQAKPTSFEFVYNGAKPLAEDLPMIQDAENILIEAAKNG